LLVDGRILILTKKLRIRIQVAKIIRILRIWIRGTLRGSDLKDGSGSWEADGLLHQPVQYLVGQVVGRPNKKERQFYAFPRFRENYFYNPNFSKKKQKQKRKFSEKCELIMANFSRALDSLRDFNPSPVADLDSYQCCGSMTFW
jgi:hypothetical protein